jgi:hypothetical protein
MQIKHRSYFLDQDFLDAQKNKKNKKIIVISHAAYCFSLLITLAN